MSATASKENPIYTVKIISVSSGTKYWITKAVESLRFTDQDKQFAKSVTIQFANKKLKSGWLSSLLKVRDRVYIYADDGTKKDEVWRGYVWTRNYKRSNDGRILKLKCYDNLIYMQESEVSYFFSKGKGTKDIVNSICSDWGVKLSYTYSSITHSKLVLRGCLSDVLTADILDLVKDRTGKKYYILSEKGKMYIKPAGTNSTVYTIKPKGDAIARSSECTMDGMTTKVVILGKEEENERKPVEATVKGDTAKFGTLQKLIDRDEETKLSEAKKEAQNIIDEDGKPKWTYEIEAVDIPWIRKGDKVKFKTSSSTVTYIVQGIDRDISNNSKTMSLTVQKAK